MRKRLSCALGSFGVISAAFFATTQPLLATPAAAAAERKEGTLRIPDLKADFLVLRAEVEVPPGTTAVEYRAGFAGPVEATAPWSPAGSPIVNNRIILEVPLSASRWKELQVRAIQNGRVISESAKAEEPRRLTLLTPERIAALPEAERLRWQQWLDASARHAARDYDTLAAECRAARLPQPRPAPSAGQFSLERGEAWFSSDEAAEIADTVISFQTPAGGWSKAVAWDKGPRQPGMAWTSQKSNPWHYCGTLDNRATTSQIRFLASVHRATGRKEVREAVLRGLDWLLAAQFPNGGWPQNYPLEAGYHEAITLNDNAMTFALRLVLEASLGEGDFAFLDEPLRGRLRAAYDRGIHCLAAAQFVRNGQKTVWAAQHDPLTLQPVAARLKEPASLSGGESAELLKFLMREAPVSPQTTAMIEPAVAWLDAHRVTGLRKVKNAAGKTDYVSDPGSGEVYWARFYDPVTEKPLFAGSDDGIVYPTFSEMAAKNKVAYDYFVTKPGEIINKEVARWRKRLAKTPDGP